MASSSSQEEDLDLGSGLSSARAASVASVMSASGVASKGTSLPFGVTTPSAALFTSDEFPPSPLRRRKGILMLRVRVWRLRGILVSPPLFGRHSHPLVSPSPPPPGLSALVTPLKVTTFPPHSEENWASASADPLPPPNPPNLPSFSSSFSLTPPPLFLVGGFALYPL